MLRDDGKGGDQTDEDGLYQALYRNLTAGDGIYTFGVSVSCREGTAAFHQHDDPGIGTFPSLPQLVSFDRQIRFSGIASGVPDNLPPIADICQDVRAECQGVNTTVQLDGTCSSDPEGEALAYQWFSPTGTFLNPTSSQPTGLFPLGRNDVTLTVTDPHGVPSVPPDAGLVVIADTIAPAVQVSLNITELWPPNHRLVEVEAAVTVQEICDPSPDIVLVSIESDEPDDAAGTGDGSTTQDVQDATYGSDDRRFWLRAERDGRGDGRTYTVTYAVTDDAGNTGFGTATVTVPHSNRGVTDDLRLTVDKQSSSTEVRWDPVTGAVRYHVVRGQLSAIRETETAIDLGDLVCTKVQASPVSDTETPHPGSALFYLTEYEMADGRRSAFGEESAAKPREPSTPCP